MRHNSSQRVEITRLNLFQQRQETLEALLNKYAQSLHKTTLIRYFLIQLLF